MIETPDIELLSRETERLLSSPFEWCDVKGGPVTLADATQDGGSQGGLFQVAGFAMAKYPITNAQYDKFLDNANGFVNNGWWNYSPEGQQWRKDRSNPEPTAFEGATLPRTRVSWFDAVAFCRWLSAELDNLVHDYSGEVRLPTEQQWQRAAVGDSGCSYPWCNGLTERFANYGKNVGRPTPVDSYPEGQSPYGVLDMVGNVWEWCLSPWGTEDVGLGGYTYRIIKGGAWNVTKPDYLRPADRGGNSPRGRLNDAGFRCAYIFSNEAD